MSTTDYAATNELFALEDAMRATVTGATKEELAARYERARDQMCAWIENRVRDEADGDRVVAILGEFSGSFTAYVIKIGAEQACAAIEAFAAEQRASHGG